MYSFFSLQAWQKYQQVEGGGQQSLLSSHEVKITGRSQRGLRVRSETSTPRLRTRPTGNKAGLILALEPPLSAAFSLMAGLFSSVTSQPYFSLFPHLTCSMKVAAKLIHTKV